MNHQRRSQDYPSVKVVIDSFVSQNMNYLRQKEVMFRITHLEAPYGPFLISIRGLPF